MLFSSMSTNKVYGDSPNEIPLKELGTRYDYAGWRTLLASTNPAASTRLCIRYLVHRKLPRI
jgi:hypothetical protein